MLLFGLNLQTAGAAPPPPPPAVSAGGGSGSPRKRKKRTDPQAKGQHLLLEPAPLPVATAPVAKPVEAKVIQLAPSAETVLIKQMESWTADSEKLAAQIKLMEEEEEEALAVLLAFL